MASSLLAVICARGGSKGIPKKNIANFCGKPLIAWTIEAALQSASVSRCILSSDDSEIISVAKRFGCEVPFVRPHELARDETPGIDPVLHAIQEVPNYDYVMLLQPTSPLRTSEDIENAFNLCIALSAPACVSVTEAETHPWLTYEIISEGMALKPLCRPFEDAVQRQKLPKAYTLNGAIYIARTEWILRNKSFLSAETAAYIMPQTRSIDIDSIEDLLFAEHFRAEPRAKVGS